MRRLIYASIHPDLSSYSSDMVMGMSTDTINRLLHSAWQSGAFEISLDEGDVGLDAKTLGFILPGVPRGG